MSLTIYLEDSQPITVQNTCHTCGHISTDKILKEYFRNNITHNLAKMANECGLYEPMWRPEENDIEIAEQMIPFLKEGLKLLVEEREKCLKFQPKNGWGSYEYLVSFVERYLDACEKFPHAKVTVER